MLTLLKRLYFHIDQRRRWQFGFLLILILLTSVAEVVSIGAVIPFLGILSAPQKVFDYQMAQPIIRWLGLTESNQLLLPLTIAFASSAVFAGAMRLLLLFTQTRLSFATGHHLSISIYQKTLFQPYSVHMSRNSSDTINGIYTKASAVTSGVILPVLTLLNSFVMLSSVMMALLFVDPWTAIIAFGGFGIIYGSIIIATRKQLVSDSRKVARKSSEAIQSLQEGLGGIRDILIHGSQKSYCDAYERADYGLKRAQGNTSIISQSPRFLMEALGILLMTSLAYVLASQSQGLAGAIPILGSLALGAQRLLPVLQQAYQSWSSLRGAQASLKDTLDLLDQPVPCHATQGALSPISFCREISMKNVSFSYDKTNRILRDINLSIPKGSRVGFVGETGSGKSTLVDVLMGLLQPTEGSICIDSVVIDQKNMPAWQQHIAHVPQDIFLRDSSIAENIAFGVPKEDIDMVRVRAAAQQAQISETIESWKDQYQTAVGERGVRLSGGQRQRIGIARALYREADVIVFDEATSALDNKTEEAVMEAISGLSQNLTLLMIAHRHSTLRLCTEVVQVKNGEITIRGNYRDFIKNISQNN